ncbi:MAG: hypothetical protein Kapaf2KO_03020 [Candidatus Kapaibacteriales bacterium]
MLIRNYNVNYYRKNIRLLITLKSIIYISFLCFASLVISQETVVAQTQPDSLVGTTHIGIHLPFNTWSRNRIPVSGGGAIRGLGIQGYGVTIERWLTKEAGLSADYVYFNSKDLFWDNERFTTATSSVSLAAFYQIHNLIAEKYSLRLGLGYCYYINPFIRDNSYDSKQLLDNNFGVSGEVSLVYKTTDRFTIFSGFRYREASFDNVGNGIPSIPVGILENDAGFNFFTTFLYRL